MPGKDETEVDNQEPTKEENEEESRNEEESEKYEDRVIDAITGASNSSEE